MAFVREKISKEDFEKYRIGSYEERIPNSLFPNYSYWVIDRERNIYLVTASSGGRDPETHNRHRYIFSVDGDVYDIYIYVTLVQLEKKHWLQDYKQQFWDFIPYFSSSNKPKSKLGIVQILFKEAMEVYRTSSTDDMTDEVDFTFDF